MKRTHSASAQKFIAVADRIAQSMGWKDHKDALAHRDESGKVGRNPNKKGER